MRLLPSQLSTIRTQPQQSKTYLSIFRPTTVLSCRVNKPAIAHGETSIRYNTVTGGSYTKVEPGMTLLVGTSLGACDIGRIRIKRISSNTIIVAENDNVNWQDNLYLTVINYVEIVPVYPRLIQDPSNAENVLFYKDYDIAYTNQNDVLGAFVCSGPHRAAFRDTGGSAQIYYSSTGTLNVGRGTLSHYWLFEGGTPTGSTSPDPGYVSYPTAGHYVVKHSVSGTRGQADVTYRYVSIYDRPGQGPNTPIMNWSFTEISGSRDDGGYTGKILVRDSITPSLIGDEIVVIFTDDWYGGVQTSIGGNAINNEKIFFVGYIIESTLKYNYETSSVEFSVGSVSDIMKDCEGFAISVESKTSPKAWYELRGLTGRKAIYHFLRWHSTVLMTTDFQYIGNNYQIQYFDSNRDSLYNAINDFMKSTYVGGVVADRQGKLWGEVSTEVTSNSQIVFSPTMTLSKQDWMGTPNILESINEKTSYLEMGGIAYSGPNTGTFSALMSCAPGGAPSYKGVIDKREGLSLISQTQLNEMTGNLLANQNSKFIKVSLDLAGKYNQMDIAPINGYGMYIRPEDTNRGILISGNYYINQMSWRYDAEKGSLLPSASFNIIVTGTPGETIVIPPPPTTDFPPITFPTPPPPIVFPTPIPPTNAGIPTVILLDSNKGVYYSTNFDTPSPNWISMNFGLPTGTGHNPLDLQVGPDGTIYISYGYTTTGSTLAQGVWSGRIGGNFSPLIKDSDIRLLFAGGAAQDINIRAMGFHPTIPNKMAMFLRLEAGAGGAHRIVYGSPSALAAGYTPVYAFTSTYGVLAGDSISMGANGMWTLTWQGAGGAGKMIYIYSLSSDCQTLMNSLILSGTNSTTSTRHIRAGTSDTFYVTNSDPSWLSQDGGVSATALGKLNNYTQDAVDCDPSGQFLMGTIASQGDNPMRSTDYGTSFGTITSLNIGTQFGRFHNLGNINQWIVVVRNTIGLDVGVWFTNDFGDTWTSKTGDFLSYVPSPQIICIRHILNAS